VFRARFSPMAELNARAHRRSTTLAVLLSALVASTSLTVVFVRGPADADQISSLKAQATALSQQLIREQLQVGGYEQQYSVATAKTAADARAITRLNHQIALDQQQISRKTGAVRQQAIASYTNYGTGSSGPESSLFSGNEESVQAASEYSGIAVGNITDAVDALRTAQHTLQAGEGALQRQEAADRAEQARQANYLAQADNTQHQLEASQAQVTGQLAVAVAHQHAAQAAAAAAAISAARRAAQASASAGSGSSASGSGSGSSSSSGTGSSSGPAGAPAQGSSSTGSAPSTPGAGGGATTDPALNPFLTCVVQAESGGNYGAVSPNGLYMGAFQFSQPTWNVAAQDAGLPALIGMPPNVATKADQDTLAVALYALDGSQPWLGDRCS
jgi:peptidoglycan hydrolase CwlO-like protein